MGDVGQEIRRLREAKGWSQPKLAVEAGVAVSGVSQIENGRRNPNSSTLIELANALEVDIADLFPKAQSPLPLEERSRASGALEVGEEERRTLNGVLEGLRRTVKRNEAAVALDEYRKQMEKRLAAGELDRVTIEETGAVAMAFWPALLLALHAEMQELRDDSEADANLAVLRAAVEHFVDFGDRVNGAYREMLREAAKARKAPALNVLPFPQRKAS